MRQRPRDRTMAPEDLCNVVESICGKPCGGHRDRDTVRGAHDLKPHHVAAFPDLEPLSDLRTRRLYPVPLQAPFCLMAGCGDNLRKARAPPDRIIEFVAFNERPAAPLRIDQPAYRKLGHSTAPEMTVSAIAPRHIKLGWQAFAVFVFTEQDQLLEIVRNAAPQRDALRLQAVPFRQSPRRPCEHLRPVIKASLPVIYELSIRIDNFPQVHRRW